VTEQFNLEGEMYGEAVLEREFNRTLHLPLSRMLEHLCTSVREFRGHALVKDDQTLLVLEYAA